MCRQYISPYLEQYIHTETLDSLARFSKYRYNDCLHSAAYLIMVDTSDSPPDWKYTLYVYINNSTCPNSPFKRWHDSHVTN